MKKYFVLTSIYFLFVFGSTAQKYTPDQPGLPNLKGKVRIAAEVLHQMRNIYSPYGGPPSVEKSYMLDSTIYMFDDKGRCIEETSYNDRGLQKMKGVYMYDENGKKIEESFYYKDGKLRERSVFKYDKNGNLIQEAKYFKPEKPYSVTTFTYNSDGNMVESNAKSDHFAFRYTYKYDDRKKMIERQAYFFDGKPSWKNTYMYDNRSNLVEVNKYLSDGTRESHKTCKYDGKLNIIELVIIAVPKEFNRNYTYKYEYDENLNWVKRMQSLGNRVDVLTERRFEY